MSEPDATGPTACLGWLEDDPRALEADEAAETDGSILADSGLPGWTRGHLLTHVARNADALRNLLTWARTGCHVPHLEMDRSAATT
jgi:maleylpyruvate isomerase